MGSDIVISQSFRAVYAGVCLIAYTFLLLGLLHGFGYISWDIFARLNNHVLEQQTRSAHDTKLESESPKSVASHESNFGGDSEARDSTQVTHTQTTFQRQKSREDKADIRTILKVFTMGAFIAIFFALFHPFIEGSLLAAGNDANLTVMGFISFAFVRVSMFAFFTLRLYYTFENAPTLQSSNRVYGAIATLIIFELICHSFLVIPLGNAVSNGAFALEVIIDFTIVIWLLILFTKKLRALMIAQGSHASVGEAIPKQASLMKLATKLTVLAITAMISDVIFVISFGMFYAVLDWDTPVSTTIGGCIYMSDLIINVACLYLNYRFSDNIYQWMCAPIHNVCLRRAERYKNEKVMEARQQAASMSNL